MEFIAAALEDGDPMNETVKFWRGVFSEPDGSPSFSRVATAVLLAFACGWVTAIVVKHYALPDFTSLVMFVGVLYGINRGATAIQSFGQKKEGQQ